MLFPVPSTPANLSLDHCATRAAIKSLLAYAHGLEDCQIDVEVCFGTIMLTGKASSVAAVDKAIRIASDVSSRPVFNDIDVYEKRLALPVRPARDRSKDRQKSGKILYMKRDTT
jgi:hypothetical protein